MKTVIVESPFAFTNKYQSELYEKYLSLCLRHCLLNFNSAPFASHGLYTRKYVLDDTKPHERELGINAGFEWRILASTSIFFIDLGWSKGMKEGHQDCINKNTTFSLVNLPNVIRAELHLKRFWTGNIVPAKANSTFYSETQNSKVLIDILQVQNER